MSAVDLPESTAINGRITMKESSITSMETKSPSAQKSERKYNLPEGLSKIQKKNLRKTYRNKEKRAIQKKKITEEESFLLPEDPAEPERLALLKKIRDSFESLDTIANLSTEEVYKCYETQNKQLQDLTSLVQDALDSNPKPIKKMETRRFTSEHLIEQLKKLTSTSDADQEAVSYLYNQLKIIVYQKNAQKFQNELSQWLDKIAKKKNLNAKRLEEAQQREKMFNYGLKIQEYKGEDLKHPPKDKLVLNRQVVEFSDEAHSVLGPPNYMYRRLEKLFGVVLERHADTKQKRSDSKLYTVYGRQLDIDNILLFLSESDFFGQCKIELPPKTVSGFVGARGTTIRKLEETLHCLLKIQDNFVIVYGSKKCSKDALNYVKETYIKKALSRDNYKIEVPLQNQIIGKALSIPKNQEVIRQIESEHHVTLRVFFSSEQKKSHIIIRGLQQNVDEAKKAVLNYLSSLKVHEFEANSEEVLDRLLKKSFSGDDDRRRGGRLSKLKVAEETAVETAPSRFNYTFFYDKLTMLIEANEHVFLVRLTPTKFALVVKSENSLDDILVKVKELLTLVSYTPVYVTMPNVLSFLFTVERLALIEKSTKATLRRLQKRNNQALTFIEIFGNEEQKKQAEEQIHLIISQEGQIKTVLLTNDEATLHIFKDKRKLLKNLQDEFNVQVVYESNGGNTPPPSVCKIIGTPDNITSAFNALMRLIEELRIYQENLHEVQVTLPAKACIASIIGTRGSIIQRIETSSKADSIRVNDDELVVHIRGTKQCCAEAERMIQVIIKRWLKNSSQQEESSTTNLELDNKKKTDTLDNNINNKHAGNENVPTDITSFPTITEAMEVNPQKRVVSRRRKAIHTGKQL